MTDNPLVTQTGNQTPSQPGKRLPAKMAVASAFAGAAGLTLWLIGGPSLVAVGLAVGGSALASLLFLTSFFRRYTIRPQTLADTESGKLELLIRNLTRAKYNQPTEKEATRATQQFDSWSRLTTQYAAVLRAKFETGELATARYQIAGASAAQVIRENLELAAQHLAGLEHAVQNAQPGSATENSRSELNTLLEANDKTLTEWQKVLTALNSIRTSKEGFTDPESTLRELEELAKRASSYSLK